MTDVFKIEIMVIDHDEIGKAEIISVLENTKFPNRCISPLVTEIESKEVEYNDDHSLNILSERKRAFKELFNE